jgi:uncharacterized RDD family membrane protein YckC
MSMSEPGGMSGNANPYTPPASRLDAAAGEVPVVLAGKGRRFGTFVIDYMGFMLFGFLFGMSVALMFGNAGINALHNVPDIVLGSALLIIYYAFFEGIWARTPGKLVFGTRVESEEGGKPTLGQVMVRTLCRFIPFEPFSFFMERGWHDSIPKTRVVLTRVS